MLDTLVGLKTTKKFISTKPSITFFGHERVRMEERRKENI